MINDVLTAVMERLNAQVQELKYIDEDWGQLDYYAENPPAKFPCVLLELQQINWRNQGAHVQDGTFTLSVKVADIKLSNTNLKSPVGQKTQAAAIWTVLEKIYKALHTWQPANDFSTLTRTATNRAKRDDGIRQFEMLFIGVYTDNAARAEPQKIKPKIIVTAP